MLIYGYKGKKCFVSPRLELWCDANYNAMMHYAPSYVSKNVDGYTQDLVRQIYNSFSTLCKFNNSLTHTYEINDEYINSINFVKTYLIENEDTEYSVDNKCRTVYDHLKVWYKRLVNNPNSLDDIKWEVARTMKYFEKQEIFRVASINLKRNYYDFVV